MDQPITTAQNPQSEKEVSKHLSRFSAKYWEGRLFRPTYKRNGKNRQVAEWYAQIQCSGRREKIGLATNDRQAASRKAAKLYSAIRTKGWTEALKTIFPERHDPKNRLTVGGHLELVIPYLGVRQVSSKKYSYCLRRIAGDIAGLIDQGDKKFDPASKPWQEKADEVKLAVLTPLAIETWKSDFLLKAEQTPTGQLAARRNVNYFVRNARSLFGKKVQKRIKDLGLPEFVNPFDGVRLENSGSTRYISTINPKELLKKAKLALARKDPESWKVVLLALGAGLRRAEIDGLCPSQINYTNASIRVVIHDHFEAKTDESVGIVFVDIGMLEELKRHIDASSQFVVEPNTPGADGPRAPGYYRCDATFSRVTKWLRDNGVPGDRPLHILRKEFGSIINAQSDIHTAKNQLRHASIATTSATYADNRKRSTVGIGEMLSRPKRYSSGRRKIRG